MGYAMGQGTYVCPEFKADGWKYYDFEDTGDWALDPTSRMVCVDDVIDPTTTETTPRQPTEDECMSGEACENCHQTASVNGVTYCCKQHCDIGWISVDTTQTPMCKCGL